MTPRYLILAETPNPTLLKLAATDDKKIACETFEAIRNGYGGKVILVEVIGGGDGV